MNGARHSPPDTGGVAAPSTKRCEATAAAQTGWSGLPNCFGMRSLEEVPFSTTPSAPLKEASRLLLDVASTPPVSGGEWRAQFIDICIDRLQRRNALLVQSAFLRKHWYYSRHAHAAVALSVDRIRRRVRSTLHLDQTAGARCRAGASPGSGSERSHTTACIEWCRRGGTPGSPGRYGSRQGSHGQDQAEPQGFRFHRRTRQHRLRSEEL